MEDLKNYACEFFDVSPFIQAAEILVAADEPIRAIQLLRNLPGYYRDNPPKEVSGLVKEIQGMIATPAFYMENPGDLNVNPDSAPVVMDNLVRGVLIRDEVAQYNAKGLTPHIVDLGPGEYWLPLALKAKGLKFTYNGIGLSVGAKEKAEPLLYGHIFKERAPESPEIFVACEIIEHLHVESEILTEFLRHGGGSDVIHISTPKYSFDTRLSRKQWRHLKELGHLRTYTPSEFQKIVCDMFPSYTWGYCDSEVMHMRGHKKESSLA